MNSQKDIYPDSPKYNNWPKPKERNARREKGMTQAKLAQKAGVKQEAIARLENGHSNPSYRTVARVAGALDKKIMLV